ncbi:MAG: sensor histidine kinase [Bacteroidota bacterium]
MEKKTWRILLIVFLLLVVSFGSAQNVPLETAVRNLKEKIKASDGTVKLKLLDSLCWLTRDKQELMYDSIVKVTISYAIDLDSFDIANRQAARLIWSYTNRLGQPEKGRSFFESFDALKLPVENNALLARFYLNGGDSYYFSEAIEEAIAIYNLASDYALEQGDSILYGTSKKYIADAYIRMGKLAEGSKMLQEVEAIYRQTKDTIRLVNTKSSRADLYSMNSFFEEAKVERDEVIALAKTINYESGIISALLNSAIDNSVNDNVEKTLEDLKLALEYARNSNEVRDRYEPQILIKLLQEYSKADSLDRAEKVFKEIQANPERYTTGYFEEAYHKSLGHYYYAKKVYDKSLEYTQKHLDFQINNNTVEEIKSTHMLLYDIYLATEKYKLALYHLKEATTINESMMGLKRSNALSYYQTLYETEKRDAKISKKEAEIELLNHKNRAKRRWIIFGGIALIAVFAIIYLFRGKRFAQERQELQETFSQKLIVEQENERSRLAMELHDSVGQKLMLLKKRTKEANNEVIETLAERSLDELRSISRGLHPAVLDRFGFSKAIAAMVDEVDSSSDILFTLDIENVDEHISKGTAIHLYRIVQECLNNVVKHSKARAVAIDIEKEDRYIHTKITDNGLGFAVSEAIRNSKSLGMNTLLKRAKIIKSKIHIGSIMNKGTTINIITPAYDIS